MTFKKLTLAASAAALAFAPIGAQAATPDRASAPVSFEQGLGGGSNTILAILTVAILGAFIILTVDDDNDIDPVSP